MPAGALLKFSRSVWPGRTAAVIYLQGCNFRCPWCPRPEFVCPVLFGPPIADKEVLGWLEWRKPFVDGVVIWGGEPTVQPDLIEFLLRLRRLGLPVKLRTNGSRPEVVWELLEANLVNSVTVSYKVPRNLYGMVSRQDPDVGYMVRETIRMVLDRGIGEVRVTVVPGIHTEDLLAQMRSEVGAEVFLESYDNSGHELRVDTKASVFLR